jgi:glycosyltransferase involved in cell wall biosynthesis
VQREYGIEATRAFNPVDVETWKPGDRAAARAELGLPDHAGVVAWHGRVALDQKGLDVLLTAWARLDRPDRRLLLIGSGGDVERLHSLRDELSLHGVLHIDRYVHDRAVLSRWLSAADVYAFPSRHEGLPVAPVEAMACGLPVVGADCSGVGDLIGDGGVVVPVGDAPALAAALSCLLGEEERRARLAAGALRRARERYSLEAIGAQLRDALVPGG